jgi:hypothetical protein
LESRDQQIQIHYQKIHANIAIQQKDRKSMKTNPKMVMINLSIFWGLLLTNNVHVHLRQFELASN